MKIKCKSIPVSIRGSDALCDAIDLETLQIFETFPIRDLIPSD